MPDIRETKTRKYMVVVFISISFYDIKYFSTLSQATRYRGTLDIFKFNKSGVYKLIGEGPHQHLHGMVTGYR